MPEVAHTITCHYTDPRINGLLGGAGAASTARFTLHYNHAEELFLRLEDPYQVPQLPIHHDVRVSRPGGEYLEVLHGVLKQILLLAPSLLAGLTYLFDPADIHRPSFYSLYSLEDRQYLYTLRMDLTFRPQEHSAITRGTNDRTAAYASRRLYVEPLFVPLAETVSAGAGISRFLIDQLISSTWVDETGRGYFVQGIWMDNDLTRFFTRLFVRPGQRIYPFYPYVCKYRTVCQSVLHFDPERRRACLPRLHRVVEFLRPRMREIEAAMRGAEFSEDNRVFRQIKALVPEEWYRSWEGITVERYLNERDMKEFRIEAAA